MIDRSKCYNEKQKKNQTDFYDQSKNDAITMKNKKRFDIFKLSPCRFNIKANQKISILI